MTEIDSYLSTQEEYDSWDINVNTNIKYKNKTLNEWQTYLKLPEVTDYANLEEVETLNYKAMSLTELIYSNLSLSKNTYISAKKAFELQMNLQKNKILEEINSIPNRKAPSQDNLERLAFTECLKEWKILARSEIIYDFWNTHSFKMTHIHSRLTSLNILKNINKKLEGY